MIDLGLFFEKSLSEVIGRTKLHTQIPRNMFVFYLKNLCRLRGQFCSTELVIDTFYRKYCSALTQYYKIDLLIEITFLSNKRYLSISFFIQFYATNNF